MKFKRKAPVRWLPKGEETFFIAGYLFICETKGLWVEAELTKLYPDEFCQLKELLGKPKGRTVISSYRKIIKTSNWSEALKSTSPNT